MAEYLKRIGTQIQGFIASLSPGRKALAGVLAVAIVSTIGLLFYWAGHKSYRPLMTGLNPEDSANVIRLLREKQIPFRVDPTGKTVEIPPESIDEMRLHLAMSGLPQSSVIGYEVFDKQSLGTTSYVQKINQKRALEGELMRTIGTMRGVKRARVHLALPAKSAFVEDERKPSASVVVDLQHGVRLDEKQIYGIGVLVSRAIEGMSVEDVVIVDSEGKMLSKTGRDAMIVASANQLDFQRQYEQNLESRIEAMLARVVGEGRVVARVNAEMDFSQVNETQTTYDADGSAVVSAQSDNQSMEGSRPGPVGLAGAVANNPDDPNQAARRPEIRSDTRKVRDVKNYKVPETVRQTRRPVGTIKKLSVAVVVDGKPTKVTGEDGKVESKVEFWAPEKLKEFEDIVASAAGIDKKRGDILEIRNMEFTREDFEEAERIVNATQKKNYIQSITIYSVISLVIILFFMFVVRPFIKWLTENTIDSVDSFLPQTIEELEKLQKSTDLQQLEEAIPVMPEKIDPEKVEGEMIKEKIVTLIDTSPHKAALVLREWVREQKKKTESDGTPEKSA